MRRLIVPLIFGLAGAAVLVALGLWQLQRLDWKEAIIGEIDARITEAPVALPAAVDPVRDRFLPVTIAGRFTGEEADVLVSRKFEGVGYRIISVMQTDAGRRIMVDRGFLPEDRRKDPRPAGPATVTGNLHWPDEVDTFTPPPDPAARLWFSRDVPTLSAALETDPVLVVARSDTGAAIEPMPVDTSGIPNDHLNYALTWFALAVVWLGMTALLLWRIRLRMA